MRSGLVICLSILLGVGVARAGESGWREPAASSYTVRTGEHLRAPYVQTYRLVEYSQQRGRWILPDFGDYDFGQGGERLLFTGVGAEFHPGKRVVLTQIVYFSQALGPGSHAARYIWVWPVLDVNIAPRLKAEAVAYPTIPLNRAADAGFDLDRAKLEYALRPRFTLGLGYSASECASTGWQNKPFLTTTISTRAGAFEFWLQKIPAGEQIQVRYQLVRSPR